MRIKCPRCGLVNKAGILECQSCGEDLKPYVNGDGFTEERENQTYDPLSVENVRRKRRTRIKNNSNDRAIKTPELNGLNWKDELEHKVAQIMKDRGRGKKGRTGLKGEPTAEVEDGKDTLGFDFERERDIDYPEEERYTGLDDRKRSRSSEVYDDDHFEDYDYDEEDLYEDEENIDTEEEEAAADYDEEHKAVEKEEYIPTDPEDVRRYLQEKVSRRKESKEYRERSLAEEYGYKRKKKKGKDRPIPPPPAPGVDSSADEADIYHSLYKPTKAAEKGTKAEEILEEETRSLINMKRVYAAVWDNIILFVINGIIIRFGADVTGVSITDLLSASAAKILVFHLLITAFYHVYFVVSNGQTIGKMILNIRLVNNDDSQVRIMKSILHVLISIAGTAFALVGYLWFLFDERGRSWADLLCGTKIELYNE